LVTGCEFIKSLSYHWINKDCKKRNCYLQMRCTFRRGRCGTGSVFDSTFAFYIYTLYEVPEISKAVVYKHLSLRYIDGVFELYYNSKYLSLILCMGGVNFQSSPSGCIQICKLTVRKRAAWFVWYVTLTFNKREKLLSQQTLTIMRNNDGTLLFFIDNCPMSALI